jgi:hypothetical protein
MYKQFKINTSRDRPQECRQRQVGGGGFSKVHSSLKHCLISDEKRNWSNGHSKHDPARKAHNLWPHPSIRQDTKPTEHTLLTIMYECDDDES